MNGMLGWGVRLRLVVMAGVFIAGVARADEDRSILRWETTVDGSLDDVWAAFTTKEGIESWMVPVAEIDLRIGGTIRTNYNREAGVGGPGTITHHILSYEPKRMITMRFTAPENAAVAKVAEAAWGVTRMDPLGPRRTRVTYTSCGWGEGPDWDKAREFFEKGNAATLEKLRQKFAKSGETAPENELFRKLKTFVGGEWIYENKREDGTIFRTRSVWEAGPGGKSLIARGWLGDASGMFLHGATQVFHDPDSGTIRFQNIDENGGIARGAIRMDDGKTLVWDWDVTSPSGKLTRFKVEMVVTDDDHYHFTVARRKSDTELVPMVEVDYRRVSAAPEEFRTMRAAAQN